LYISLCCVTSFHSPRSLIHSSHKNKPTRFTFFLSFHFPFVNVFSCTIIFKYIHPFIYSFLLLLCILGLDVLPFETWKSMYCNCICAKLGTKIRLQENSRMIQVLIKWVIKHIQIGLVLLLILWPKEARWFKCWLNE